MITKFLLVPMASVAILATAAGVDAQPKRVQVGTLSCSVSAGIGIRCHYSRFQSKVRSDSTLLVVSAR